MLSCRELDIYKAAFPTGPAINRRPYRGVAKAVKGYAWRARMPPFSAFCPSFEAMVLWWTPIKTHNTPSLLYMSVVRYSSGNNNTFGVRRTVSMAQSNNTGHWTYVKSPQNALQNNVTTVSRQRRLDKNPIFRLLIYDKIWATNTLVKFNRDTSFCTSLRKRLMAQPGCGCEPKLCSEPLAAIMSAPPPGNWPLALRAQPTWSIPTITAAARCGGTLRPGGRLAECPCELAMATNMLCGRFR